MDSVAGSELKSKGALSSIASEDRIQFALKSGFHFNPEAPNRIAWSDQSQSIPVESSPAALAFVRPKTAIGKSGKAAIYVCDDEKSFCEIHRIEIGSSKAGAGGARRSAAPASKSLAPTKPDTLGFIHDHFEIAEARAKASKKLILVDFQARWCPGCRRMETEIFSDPHFQKLTSDWVKVSIDVDRYENFDLIGKYFVSSIPDLIILDSDAHEISRIIDYQPLAQILSWLRDGARRPVSLTNAANAQGIHSPSDLKRLGLNLFYAQKYAEAIDVFCKLPVAPLELIQARIELAEKRDDPSLIQILDKAVQAEPGSFRSFQWRLKILGLLKKKNSDFKPFEDIRLKEARLLVEEWLKDETKLEKAMSFESVGEFSGLENFYTATIWAESLKELGASDSDLKGAWDIAVGFGSKNLLVAHRPGPSLRYLIVLTEAARYDQADVWAKMMIKKDPLNHDLLRRRLKILLEKRDFDQGILIGLRALTFASGRMEFLIVENLAKCYLGNQDKKAATEILSRYLCRGELKLEKMKSYRDRLVLLRSQADG